MPRLLWVGDTRIITSGDASATYASRAWNVRTGQWETTSGTWMSPSDSRPYRLRGVEMRVYKSTMVRKSGVRCWVGVVMDPLDTKSVIEICCDIHASCNAIVWKGDFPMPCGIMWTIPKGGVVATDVVSLGVHYELG